jgi:hypothetical protein
MDIEIRIVRDEAEALSELDAAKAKKVEEIATWRYLLGLVARVHAAKTVDEVQAVKVPNIFIV